MATENAPLATFITFPSPFLEESQEEEEEQEEAASFQYRPSLAGTEKPYVVIAGRVREWYGTYAVLHVQGLGPKGNRDYGVADDIKIPLDLAHWIHAQHHPLSSAANTSASYLPMQVRPEYDGSSLRFQVAGTPFNRMYGAVFGVKTSGCPDVAAWLTDSDA